MRVIHGDGGAGSNRTKLYTQWANMVARCNGANRPNYHSYGGRGITVCDEWLDYTKYKAWAMAHGYKPGLTIDRINNNGNYCPSNCRFITVREQLRNTSRTVWVDIGSQRKCLADWCEIFGLCYETVYYRYRKGWPVDLLFAPPKKCGRGAKGVAA